MPNDGEPSDEKYDGGVPPTLKYAVAGTVVTAGLRVAVGALLVLHRAEVAAAP